jgi:RimJ/RimL family protein N-acetyltransferase
MRSEDAATLATWQEQGGFLRHFDAVPAVPRTEAQIVKRIEQAQEASDGYLLAIRGNADDLLLGQLELDGIAWTHGVAWLSVVIFDPEQRGQGYGREAIGLALRFAFHELNLQRVQLTVFSYNTGAIAIYERLGFVHEGTFREFLERDGQRHDMLLYGLLRREWETAAGRETSGPRQQGLSPGQ